jgi:guanine deaminase
MREILRASIFHTPADPFRSGGALQHHADGGLLIVDGRIAACGDFAAIQRGYPEAAVRDLRGGFLLPGFIDTHIHYPQVRVIGELGRSLLDWLEQCALPEEARMADTLYASEIAHKFVRALASHGTTTALVFGAHFPAATAALFEAASDSGLRIVSGQVFSDRNLRPELHQTAESAYRDGCELIRRFHGKGLLSYAVTPRFALSVSESMLEVCQSLMREFPGVRFQTHINENHAEMEAVSRAFPWARDYLAVYERYGLGGPGAVMAHNVHGSDSELERLAGAGTAVAHCPASNAALGSGIFPMARHLAAGVRFALGTDVGGGTGFGILKEGLQAYLMQRVAPQGLALNAAQLLFLATKAGAAALAMADETGDFTPGKSADIVYLRAPKGSALEEVLRRAAAPEDILAALFTLAGKESVEEVRVAGKVVHDAASA